MLLWQIVFGSKKTTFSLTAVGERPSVEQSTKIQLKGILDAGDSSYRSWKIHVSLTHKPVQQQKNALAMFFLEMNSNVHQTNSVAP